MTIGQLKVLQSLPTSNSDLTSEERDAVRAALMRIYELDDESKRLDWLAGCFSKYEHGWDWPWLEERGPLFEAGPHDTLREAIDAARVITVK